MAISILLLIVAGLLGWWLHASIRKYDADNDLQRLQPSQDMIQKMAQEKSLPQLPSTKRYIPEEFALIPENNLFSESRTRWEDTTEDAAQPEAQPLSQKPILVGINITDSKKTALLVATRARSQGQNRRAEVKRIGDVFQGHTISEIAPDHIVLESGSRKEIIPLHEGSKQPSAGRTPILSTRVVSLSGGAVTGGTPVIASAGSAGTARPAAAAPKKAPAAASKPEASSTATAAATPVRQPRAATTVRAQSTQRTPQRSQTPDSTSPKTRVLRTPFGDVIRDVPDYVND